MSGVLEMTCVVLCNPADSRNVGGAIRAVTNAGLSGIRIVTQTGFDDRDLLCYSSGSIEYANVSFYGSVEEATADCPRVIGTSRRLHDPDAPPEWPAAGLAKRLASPARTAVLFGAERTGLIKSELDLCSAVVHIPTSETYPSMNLAHAVACIGYELARPEDVSQVGPTHIEEAPRLPAAARDAFYGQISHILTDLSYPPGRSAPAFVRRLRKILHRANLNQQEMSMLGGVFSELHRLGRAAGAAGAVSEGQNHTGDDGGEGHQTE
jgi:tRNA (cytidine32/uridine32-2'-O)-methyltransferase